MFATEAEHLTARFAMLCFMAVFNGFGIRTEHVNLFDGLSKNKLFWQIALWIVVGTIVLCTFAGDLLKVTVLNTDQWIAVLILSLIVIPVDILRKLLTSKGE